MLKRFTFEIGFNDPASEATLPRRRLILGSAALLGANLLPVASLAGPLDSIPLNRSAKIVRQGSVVVSPRSSSGPGLAGADVYSPARAWLDVDFAVTDKLDLTLMILTQQQKEQVSRGMRLAGDPLARVAIEGPETANHSVTVRQGNYFIGFLNDNAKATTLAYRISIRAY